MSTQMGEKEYQCGTNLCSIGVHFGDGHPANVGRLVHSFQDNNLAEAKAVLEALNIASKHGIRKVKIFSDSQNTIDIVQSHKAQTIHRLKRQKKP